MELIKTTGWDEGTKALADRLERELRANDRVLWLVCGGSSIASEVEVMASIPEELTEHLTILLTDERFGEVGHPDSNAKQLQDAGFQPQMATFIPVLAAGYTMAETRKRYEEVVKDAIEQAAVIIGQFGIGPDGHIAGILPHSPALAADGWFTIYDAPPFVRATLTFKALRHIDAAYAMAFGDNKHQVLVRLKEESLPLGEQPSQILKELPEAYIFNDQIGGKQ